MGTNLTALLSPTGRIDWNTPEPVVERLLRMGPPSPPEPRWRSPIGLDPCSNPGSIVPARVAWELDRDGDSLVKSWAGYGLVYVNPPYGRAITPFMDKLAETGRDGNTELVALVPARTDTKWFQRACQEATALCVWRGRLTFLGAEHPAPFPSAVFYYGGEPIRFVQAFADAGHAFLL